MDCSQKESQNILTCSRVPEIWEKFYEKLDLIEDLEKRANEHVKRFRRRVAGALDQTMSHRRSHLRLFVTHTCDSDMQQNQRSEWTLVIEGKLLVGLLDHASARQVDALGAYARRETTHLSPSQSSSHSSSLLPTVSLSVASDGDGAARSNDRNRYRSVGDVEEDPVEPTLFTHAFDKLSATFRTVWQPISLHDSAPQLAPPKKSRKRKAETPQVQVSVNPKQLRASAPTKIAWNKSQSGDAHTFRIDYKPLEAPEAMELHSVVATIALHPSRPETLYRPSQALAERLFPKHAKRAKSNSGGDKQHEPVIPVENDIRVPSLLTLQEVLLAFHQYISDKKLQDEGDKSLILCDKTLSELLDCHSLNFGDLQAILRSKNLISPVGLDDEPIELTYIMKEHTASPQELPPTGTFFDIPEGHHHQLLSCDTDVYVPSFFHWRAREMMRRIKRREFEYTSSRTKGRYLLVASRGNEDIIKTKIGECISGQGYAAENIPVFLALAKAAPAGSEARIAAQIDARTCSLVDRLGESSRQVQAAWDLVDSCKEVYPSSSG